MILHAPRAVAVALASVAFAAAITAPARADMIERVYQHHAAGVCQGALPAFAGTLRARPLGVGNEGDAPAFLSCSLPLAGGADTPVNRVSLYFTNTTATPLTINCTGVFGSQRLGAVYLVKSVTVEPGNFRTIFWTSIDNGGASLRGPGNVNCGLVPGAVLLETFNYFNVEIGD